MESFFNKSLNEYDSEISYLLGQELDRQRNTLEMIASENFVPLSVLQAAGSVLTNKYAEGYPGARYYGGCQVVDKIESLAIERARAVFGGEYINVQPHSGAQANAAVLHALAKPGDTILGLELAHGGHLSHGMKINFSGKFYNAVSYGVNKDTYLIDYDQVAQLAEKHKPSVIIAGWSAYPRIVDFKKFREIADAVGAKLWVDMAHFAGLVAAGLHPSPIGIADVVSSTVHKTLGGPRSGVIFAKEQYKKAIASAVFPGQQGGPLMHIIAAKAVCFKYLASDEFKLRQKITLDGAKAISARLNQNDAKENGISVLTGGTDVHLVLADLQKSALNGQQAEDILHSIGITVNRNAVPYDPRPAKVTSGLRIGTPALATRGLQAKDFEEIADIIALALISGAKNGGTALESDKASLLKRTKALCDAYPLYEGIETKMSGIYG